MGYNIVGITACAAGIAHTYMAAESLIQAGLQRGDTVHIETQGSIGAEDILTPEDIRLADVVIIAADVDVDLSRFQKKKVFKVKTINAMKDGCGVLAQAIQEGKVLENKEHINMGKEKEASRQGDTLMTHIVSGLSYMGILCIVAGLLFAIASIFANHNDFLWTFDTNQTWGLYVKKLYEAAVAAFQLAIPLFAGFMAKSIADKPAVAPAMIGAYMANQPSFIGSHTGGGFFSALCIALIVGYFVKFVKGIAWPTIIAPMMSFLIIPFVTTLLILFLIVFVIGRPMAIGIHAIYQIFMEIQQQNIFAACLVGAILGGMMGYDFGGPINKIAMILALAIFADTINAYGVGKADFLPQTATQAAVSIAPLSIWLSSKLCKSRFTSQEIDFTKKAFYQGIMGVSEGAIPFAESKRYPIVFASVCGSAVAGGLVTLTGCKFYGGIGSVLGTFIGYVEQPIPYLTWILCLCAGILVSTTILLVKRNAE